MLHPYGSYEVYTCSDSGEEAIVSVIDVTSRYSKKTWSGFHEKRQYAIISDLAAIAAKHLSNPLKYGWRYRDPRDR